jgi:hypothetical protein
MQGIHSTSMSPLLWADYANQLTNVGRAKDSEESKMDIPTKVEMHYS